LGRTACTRFAKRNTHDPAGGVFLGDTFGSMTERGTSAGDGSGHKTRYHLLTTDGGIVADQRGKMAGEAAIGVVLKAPLEEISEPIGPAKDHHVAEYRALIRGLEAARSRGIGHLRVCLDSALLVNQLNGRWKVKAEHLKPLHEQADSLIQQFADIKITWVPREPNAEADALASTPLGPLRPKPKPSIDELPLE
jgi:ribonuclease HI